MKLLLLCALLCLQYSTRAQFSENFSDGETGTDPAWSGSAGNFIVNPALQLQSSNAVVNSSFYLATANSLCVMAQWEFDVQLAFNPSGSNYVDVFLSASAADATAAATTGYFVRLGNTDDEVSLYRKDASGSVKLIDGSNGTLNSSNNTLRIKVTRDAAYEWRLFRDQGITGNYTEEGKTTDAQYTSCAFFAILIKQSTTSFFQKHFFDNISVKTYIPDITAPEVVSAVATTSSRVDLLFNESIDAQSAALTANYFTDQGIGLPQSAERDPNHTALVHLTYAADLPDGKTCTININGINDLAGNTLHNGTASFVYHKPQLYNIIIDELMADPTPVNGLPDAEWIELKNTSAFPIDLLNWRLSTGSSNSTAFPSYILQPGAYLVICSNTAAPLLQLYGPVLSINSFPALNNTGDELSLTDATGKRIHAIAYHDSWYGNELKKMGGWSLEMIDTQHPCIGAANWTASTHTKGGTPGMVNAAAGTIKDEEAPRLLRAYAENNRQLILIFSETLDSTNASVVLQYELREGIGTPVAAIPVGPLFNQVRLQLAQPLQAGQLYNIRTKAIKDCNGNTAADQFTRVALAAEAGPNDVVINELLFNPSPNGTDFIELYNRGDKVVDLFSLYIGNRNSAGAVSSISPLSKYPYLFFPGDHIAFCNDPAIIKREYAIPDTASCLQVNALPSFNDDKGNAVLMNSTGTIIDELAYTEKWHFKLVSNPEGVSLERIDPHTATQQEANWHSASTSSGYATPGYRNSQYVQSGITEDHISILPPVISPDNDGRDDFATITYHLPSPGYVANITIFDAAGRVVRYLQQNALCGIDGYFRWDGLAAYNGKLSPGIYIILTELFNLEGKKKKIKKTIVVAGK